MGWARFLRGVMRLLLGRRLPTTAGRLNLSGIRNSVQIHRDEWGIPCIQAANDHDAWFGVGFCHGQDRTFELEGLLRVGRGTLAELLGRKALPVDRLSRRIGFFHAAEQQVAVLDEEARAALIAYAAGVNAGATHGLAKKPHEFAILGGRPTSWTPADVLAFVKTLSFLLVANWDAELVRLQVCLQDGAESAFVLDPLSKPRPRDRFVAGMEQLRQDLQALSDALGRGGGSNNWAIAGRRTATGRPLVANDPHLFPFLPSQWYLAHVSTPTWRAAGATLVGAPAIAVGHNGFAAWSATAGLVDNTDFFIEEIGKDGRSVREANGFQPCTIRRETIRVRGGGVVVEEVLETPRGPIVSPALMCEGPALSMRAVWLDAKPVRGLLQIHRCRSMEEFRDMFRHWPCLSLNMVYADTTGRIAWQLVGQSPIRRGSSGLTPQLSWAPEAGWEPDYIPFEQMPYCIDPQSGYVASANNHPDPDGRGPYLGNDFLDSYRFDAIAENLAARTDWTVAAAQDLQRNVVSLPWREMRDAVLRCPPQDVSGIRAWEVLRDWNGHVRADSAGAAVFELFVACLLRRITSSKAPKSFNWEMGQRACIPGNNLFYCRRLHHLSALLREQPVGWFASWEEEIRKGVSHAGDLLRRRCGDDPAQWKWGAIHQLTLRHPYLQTIPILRSIFNEGSLPIDGDGDTIMQSAVVFSEPLAETDNIPGMRMVVDVGQWGNSRFVIAGGQSGNPLSPHFLDLFSIWQRGGGVPIAWTDDEVRAATKETLTLTPQT